MRIFFTIYLISWTQRKRLQLRYYEDNSRDREEPNKKKNRKRKRKKLKNRSKN